jgi:adenylyltransferase/sulfurtransferase
MTVLPGETACLRCVIESPPEPGVLETCDTAGVIGPAVNAVASLAAAEALKVLAGRRDLVRPRLLALDVWEGSLRAIDTGPLKARGGCPACDGGERRWLREAAGSRPAVLCGRNAVQITPAPAEGAGGTLDFEEFAGRWAGVGVVTRTAYLLRVVVEGSPYEVTLFRDGRAIVRGTDDVAAARGVYSRYVGL